MVKLSICMSELLCVLILFISVYSVISEDKSLSRLSRSTKSNVRPEFRSKSRGSGGHDTFYGSRASCSPCDCHTKYGNGASTLSVVDCSGQNLTAIPIHLRNLSQFIDLDLVDSTIMNFSRNRLTKEGALWSLCEILGSSLKEVSFAWNGFTDLPKSLKGCKDSVEDLTLTGNLLKITDPLAFQELESLHSLHGLWVVNSLPSPVFSPLTALSHLELTYNSPVISGDLFRNNLPSLRVLWLTLTGVQELPSDLLLPPNLTELRLSGIKLKHFPSDFLKEIDNLSTLHLELPEVRRLELELGDKATSQLKYLSVQGVWEVTSDSLSQLISLETLQLKDIRTLMETSFFRQLSKLKSLVIANCSLAADRLLWLQELPVLTSLSLKQTQLARLNPDIQSGLSTLQHLDLSYNLLKEIPREFLSRVNRTLEGLDLSMNLLEHINVSSFPLMPNLKGLDLSQNSLAVLDLDAFVNMPALSQLMAHGNALIQVDGDIIANAGFNHLGLLDLSHNLLLTIPEGIPLDKVETIDLSSNPLTQGFPVNRLESLTKAVAIELEETPVACNCEMYRLVAIDILFGGICNSPPSLNGQPAGGNGLREYCNWETMPGDKVTKANDAGLSLPTLVYPEDDDKGDEGEAFWKSGRSIMRTFGPPNVLGQGIDSSSPSKHSDNDHARKENARCDNCSDDDITGQRLNDVNTTNQSPQSDFPSSNSTIWGVGWNMNVRWWNASAVTLENNSNSLNESVKEMLKPGGNVQASGFTHVPWLITTGLLLALVGFGYIAYRWNAQSGTHTLADEMGADNKAITAGKMELMELGVAPPGSMPIIM